MVDEKLDSMMTDLGFQRLGDDSITYVPEFSEPRKDWEYTIEIKDGVATTTLLVPKKDVPEVLEFLERNNYQVIDERDEPDMLVGLFRLILWSLALGAMLYVARIIFE